MSGAHSSYSMSGALSSDRLAGAFSEESLDDLDQGSNGQGGEEPHLGGSEPGSVAIDGDPSVPSLEAASDETSTTVSVPDLEAPLGEAASTAVISSEATPCISSSE
jgi:hypothetical protein